MRPSVSHHRPRHVNARIQDLLCLYLFSHTTYCFLELSKVVKYTIADKQKPPATLQMVEY